MSGHSKWKTTKNRKMAVDAKRSSMFSKLANAITAVAREKGTDPNMNPSLRAAILKARSFNMPNDNIDRAIKRGSSDSGENFENIVFEGYGPGKSALLIETITDNRNRTSQDVKNILNKNGGSFASAGSVMWLFDKVGKITLEKNGKDQDELELLAIDAGALDIKEEDDEIIVLTKPDELYRVSKELEDKDIKLKESVLDYEPKNELNIEDEETKEKIEKLFEALDENNDVQEIYSNVNF